MAAADSSAAASLARAVSSRRADVAAASVAEETYAAAAAAAAREGAGSGASSRSLSMLMKAVSANSTRDVSALTAAAMALTSAFWCASEASGACAARAASASARSTGAPDSLDEVICIAASRHSSRRASTSRSDQKDTAARTSESFEALRACFAIASDSAPPSGITACSTASSSWSRAALMKLSA